MTEKPDKPDKPDKSGKNADMSAKTDDKSPEIPDYWRDPSGWRPTELQMSIPPEAKGKPWHKWMYKQPVCDPAQLEAWIQLHGPDALPAPTQPKRRKASKRLLPD